MTLARYTLACRPSGWPRRALLWHPDGREGPGALYFDIPTAGKAPARSTLTSRRPGRRRRALLWHPDGREGSGELYFGIPTAGKAPAAYTTMSPRWGRYRQIQADGKIADLGCDTCAASSVVFFEAASASNNSTCLSTSKRRRAAPDFWSLADAPASELRWPRTNSSSRCVKCWSKCATGSTQLSCG